MKHGTLGHRESDKLGLSERVGVLGREAPTSKRQCRWWEYVTHKGIMCAPLIGPVRIREYLQEGQIEQVLCDGESYGGARPCHYEWVRELHDACREFNITFVFCSTGRRFVRDGKLYRIEDSRVQSEQASRSGLSFQGKPMTFQLCDTLGCAIPETELYQPYYGEHCQRCGMKLICNGCSRCGRCGIENT